MYRKKQFDASKFIISKFLQAKEWLSEVDNRGIAKFSCYFVVLILYGVFTLNFHKGTHHAHPSGDYGLILYTIVRNIQKISKGDFSDWTNVKIFYPSENTLAYTDHFYLHSLIGAPYYLVTKDPLGTYNFIFLVQLIIAIIGYYKVADKLFSKPASFINQVIIIITGLFFVYSPLFLNRHPQMNFYGFIPWIVYFCLKFLESKKIKYIYLTTLAFLLQISVGVYLQLFVSIFFSLLLIIVIAYLISQKRFKPFLKSKLLLHYIIAFIVTSLIVLIINYPYIKFSREVGIVRSVEDLAFYGADIVVSFFVPHGGHLSDVYTALFPYLRTFANDYTYWEAHLFVGFAGVGVLVLSWITSILIIIDKKFLNLKGSKELLVISSFMLFAMFVFSLGPFLKILGTTTAVKLPYYFLYNLSFVFRSIRATSRIIVVMALPVALLMYFWMSEILRRDTIKKGVKYLILFVFSIVVLCDIYKQYEVKDHSGIYDYVYIYEEVNSLSGKVLLELPSGISCVNLSSTAGRSAGYESFYEFLHIYHDKWTINGYSGYYPPTTEEIIGTIDLNFDDREKVEEVIQEYDIEIILIHKKQILDEHRKNYEILIDGLKESFDSVFEDENYLLLSRS